MGFLEIQPHQCKRIPLAVAEAACSGGQWQMSRVGAAPGVEGEKISGMEGQIPEIVCKKCTHEWFPPLAVPFLATESCFLSFPNPSHTDKTSRSLEKCGNSAA